MTEISLTASPSNGTVQVVRYNGDTIAVLKDSSTFKGLVPFDLESCEVTPFKISDDEPTTITLKDRAWKLQLKCIVSLDPLSENHWFFLSAPRDNRLDDLSLSFSQKNLSKLIENLEALLAPRLSAGPKSYRLFLMSEPQLTEGVPATRFRFPKGEASQSAVVLPHERVWFADTPVEIVAMLLELLQGFFIHHQVEPTVVVWPFYLPFPVNVHATTDVLRRAEHEALLLPPQSLLQVERRIQDWDTAENLIKPPPSGTQGAKPERERRHIVQNPHLALKKGPSPPIVDATTHLVSGTYDYFHYRSDGFIDDGWGCAYRSLQTILSWFRYEGYLTQPVPSIQSLQKILAVIDPDKSSKPNFVGSKEWIGSIEIMLVLGYFMPGLECTIKHLESGSELDTDPSLQLTLQEHFKKERSPPIMIGGSSYAQTILGIYADVDKAEALYLILDPHYSANPTDLKTAVSKGYVGWKQAKKFFNFSSWYNICIPRVDLYDPR
ncbi:unnamed protein product [Phytomonas sp. EM1]|nr:unnamed protein product [Phytomonas sp. EM1]|eukprot:CCW59858.1 unnamed protein product [Phytomonas sp. isolate EM1]